MKERILVALDVDSTGEAVALAEALRDEVGGFKIGMRLFYREGPEVVRRLGGMGRRLFLDLKLHDIPQTVAHGVRGLIGLGADIINVHASGGLTMMRAAKEAAQDEAQRLGMPAPVILAVTVLTSLEQQNLSRELGFGQSLEETVISWAGLAKAAGLDGVVASPLEIAALRSTYGPDFLIVTPGIRPAGSAVQDQKRTMTPAQALARGADYLVIGRPITAAPDPVRVARAIVREIQGP
jgi:orotidine-5'-phosphate decarboxylase